MRLGMALGFLIVLNLAGQSWGQEVVAVGKGSYAGSPPTNAGNGIGRIENENLRLVKLDDRPIPSNKWWTQLVVTPFARSLWSYPFKVDTSERGLEVFFPVKWLPSGNDPNCDYPLGVGGKDFHPTAAKAKDWSDWLISFRLAESSEKYADITLGEGMPYVWVEYHGVQPVLTLPRVGGAGLKFFGMNGPVTGLTMQLDSLGIQTPDRSWGIFGPVGTRFKWQPDNTLQVEFAGKAQYLVICPLTAAKDLEYFHRYAYAVPRDTQFSWQYDSVKGMVTTRWKVTTELLKGSEKQIIQGWIPHHYRNTTNNLVFNKLEYLSPRGKLRCAVGNEFVISYPFNGVVPNQPGPKPLGGAHDYQPARMHAYLADLAAKPNFGADTYWGGKDILRFGQCALMAQQMNDPLYGKFVESLKQTMANWYTYTPGEKDHYFAYYPKWKALVGINPSYGSEVFNDHHFHFGYFTFASALLAMHDADFAKDYGELATLVAKEYANWDRTDKRFPFLRTFDIWAGHSWAGGTSSPGGNNQESSSEAVQSWAGLIYLGQALGDKEMTATGIMGYALETQATMEYWFNVGGDTFPPEWKHKVTGMVWSGGKVFGTYFTGDPAWVYGIQWLPASPMLSYLVRDPAFARKSYENMLKDFEINELAEAAKAEKAGKKYTVRPGTIQTFGAALGSVMLGYVLMYDPAWVAEQMDTLWDQPGENMMHNAGEMAVIYYQTHAMRGLGRVDWTCHGSSPTSMVYVNDTSKGRTFIVWNPRGGSEVVRFYEGGKIIGQMTALPQQLSSVHKLETNLK